MCVCVRIYAYECWYLQRLGASDAPRSYRQLWATRHGIANNLGALEKQQAGPMAKLSLSSLMWFLRSICFNNCEKDMSVFINDYRIFHFPLILWSSSHPSPSSVSRHIPISDYYASWWLYYHCEIFEVLLCWALFHQILILFVVGFVFQDMVTLV